MHVRGSRLPCLRAFIGAIKKAPKHTYALLSEIDWKLASKKSDNIYLQYPTLESSYFGGNGHSTFLFTARTAVALLIVAIHENLSDVKPREITNPYFRKYYQR